MNMESDFLAWCSNYALCQGCPFAGGKCVAPLADYDTQTYKKWLNEMHNDIVSHEYFERNLAKAAKRLAKLE